LISSRTKIKELATIVSQILIDVGIDAVLTGGSVVSIYSDNQYESYDLDYVSSASIKDISEALSKIGFKREKGRHFVHKNTKYFVEFLNPPLVIGDELVNKNNKIKLKNKTLYLLTPTYCVMDRLASFFYWNDKQCLAQALMVAKKQKVNLSKIKHWSKKEGMLEKFDVFYEKLRKDEV
jgi:hypothetical protein